MSLQNNKYRNSEKVANAKLSFYKFSFDNKKGVMLLN